MIVPNKLLNKRVQLSLKTDKGIQVFEGTLRSKSLTSIEMDLVIRDGLEMNIFIPKRKVAKIQQLHNKESI